MKILFLFLFIVPFAYSQETIPEFKDSEVVPVSPSFPTEDSSVVPEVVKPETSKVEEVVQEAAPVEGVPATVKESKRPEVSSNSRARRAESFGTIMVGYQLLTTWLPSKKTISYTHIFTDKWSLEGEYSWASLSPPSFIGVDLGGIKEKRYSLQARRYAGNSFNFTFGAVYSDLKAGLGSDITNNVGQELDASIRAQNLGVTGGIGNRWQLGNGITFGVDWIRINIPVLQTRVEDNVLKKVGSQSDRTDLKNVIRTFNRIPTVVLFGVGLGYTF